MAIILVHSTGYEAVPKRIHNDDGSVLVNLKYGVDKGQVYFFLFLKEKAFSNILNKKLMKSNKVENEH